MDNFLWINCFGLDMGWGMQRSLEMKARYATGWGSWKSHWKSTALLHLNFRSVTSTELCSEAGTVYNDHCPISSGLNQLLCFQAAQVCGPTGLPSPFLQLVFRSLGKRMKVKCRAFWTGTVVCTLCWLKRVDSAWLKHSRFTSLFLQWPFGPRPRGSIRYPKQEVTVHADIKTCTESMSLTPSIPTLAETPLTP